MQASLHSSIAHCYFLWISVWFLVHKFLTWSFHKLLLFCKIIEVLKLKLERFKHIFFVEISKVLFEILRIHSKGDRIYNSYIVHWLLLVVFFQAKTIIKSSKFDLNCDKLHEIKKYRKCCQILNLWDFKNFFVSKFI